MTLRLHRHCEFDVALEVLRGILGREKFVPTVLSDSCWEKFYETNADTLSGAAKKGFANLVWSNQKDILLACFAIPDEVFDMFPTRNADKFPYAKMFDLFVDTVNGGFLPTVVLASGPSPNSDWIPLHSFAIELATPPVLPTLVATSTYPIGPITATPALTSTPTTTSTTSSTNSTSTNPNGSATPIVAPVAGTLPLVNSLVPPLAGAMPNPVGGLTLPNAPPVVSAGDIEALFGQLGAGPSQTPVQGTHSTYIDLSPIPQSLLKVLKLDKLLPLSIKVDKRIVIRTDGTISSKKVAVKIDSAHKLSIALLTLQRVTLNKDPTFPFTEFSSYIARIMNLCNNYSLDSVVDYEYELRKWLTYWSLPWSADNRVIADMFLVSLPRHQPKNPKAGDRPSKNICRDFNKGVCSRAKCRFRHACSVCGLDHAALACPENQKP